ncbi:hypothetical protein ACM25O_09085 [Sulfitobacter pontiacus]
MITNDHVFMRGVSLIQRNTSGGACYGSFVGGIDIENCDFIFANKAGFPHIAVAKLSSTGSYNFQRNVIYDASTGTSTVSGQVETSDYNVIYPASTDIKSGGTIYNDVAAYVAATSLDANTLTADPAISGGGRKDVPQYAFASNVWGQRAGAVSLSSADRWALYLAEIS